MELHFVVVDGNVYSINFGLKLPFIMKGENFCLIQPQC